MSKFLWHFVNCSPPDSSVHGIFQARIVGRSFLLQGIFLTQRSNSFLLYCRQFLYPQSHCRKPSVKVQFSRSVMFDSLWPHGLQHTRLPCPSPTPGVYSYMCPLIQWCHPTISSSAIPFSSHLQSFPASGPFPMSKLFISSGQSIGLSASTSVLPRNIHWLPLWLTCWISLQSNGLSRVFSYTTVQKHQFFSTQLFLSPTFTSIHDYWKNHSLA